MDQIRPFLESLRLEVEEVDHIKVPILVVMEVRVVAVRGILRLYVLVERGPKGMRAERVIHHISLQVVVVVLQALALTHLLPQETADFLGFI